MSPYYSSSGNTLSDSCDMIGCDILGQYWVTKSDHDKEDCGECRTDQKKLPDDDCCVYGEVLDTF